MIVEVVLLILSLLALLAAGLVLAVGAVHLDHRALRWHRYAACGALFMFVTGPVAALTVAPLHGARLAVVMAYGFVQLGVLAIEVAILHQMRVAKEALP